MSDAHYFECTANGSYKFWLIKIDDNNSKLIHIFNGRINSNGNHLVKTFDTGKDAKEYMDKQIKSKLKKKYIELPVPGNWESGDAYDTPARQTVSRKNNNKSNSNKNNTTNNRNKNDTTSTNKRKLIKSETYSSSNKKVKNDNKTNSDDDEDDERDNKPLKGMVAVITGTLTVPRKTFQTYLKSYGAKVANSVNKQVTHVIRASDAESTTKLTKALQENKIIVSESEIRAMVGQETSNHEDHTIIQFDDNNARYFECKSGTSNKFWNIERVNSIIKVNYGRIGSKGTISQRDHGSIDQAIKHYDHVIGEKLKKGYIEIQNNNDNNENNENDWYFVAAIPDESTYESKDETVLYNLILRKLSKPLFEWFKTLFNSDNYEELITTQLTHNPYLHHIFSNNEYLQVAKNIDNKKDLLVFLKARILVERGVKYHSNCIVIGETREFEEEYAFFQPSAIKDENLGHFFNGKVIIDDNNNVSLISDTIKGPAYLDSYE